MRGIGLLGLAAVLLGLSGCGVDAAARAAPRAALQTFLADLASGDVQGACRTATPRAVSDLARAFNGSTCAQTMATVTHYVEARAGEQAAVHSAVVLPTLDIPLSPAPYRRGSSTTTLRVSYEDPVLGEPQELDVGLRRVGGSWRVDSGIAALFTLLS
jgi:hypothetical protein